jgi:hypothetical protein
LAIEFGVPQNTADILGDFFRWNDQVHKAIASMTKLRLAKIAILAKERRAGQRVQERYDLVVFNAGETK